MAKIIIAKEGDCFINICSQEGFYWETVWNHAENQKLRELRKKHNILKKGDRIYIPDWELKEYQAETEKRHTYQVKVPRANFTLTLMNLGQPRANEEYTLIVNGFSRTGTTDETGTFTEPIPPKARYGRLLLGEKQDEEITINFGYIDPIEEISGVQKRLSNLGFYDGEIDDELNAETTGAIAEFQRSVEIPGDGELTDETRQKLVEVHGS
jgi:hypothetical protein